MSNLVQKELVVLKKEYNDKNCKRIYEVLEVRNKDKAIVVEVVGEEVVQEKNFESMRGKRFVAPEYHFEKFM